MSLTTLEMNLSNFPGGVDLWEPVFDLPPHLVASWRRLQQLKEMPLLNFTEQSELNRLVLDLAPYMMTPDMWNTFTSSLSHLQKFFNEEVFDFIVARQEEMNARIDQFKLIGVHDESQPYLFQNMVHHSWSGDLYIALRDVGAGTAITDESAWRRLSLRGAEGAPGVALTWRGDYHIDNTYVVGDAIRHNGIIWWATVPIGQGVEPPDNAWQSISSVVISEDRPNLQTGMVWRQDLGTL